MFWIKLFYKFSDSRSFSENKKKKFSVLGFLFSLVLVLNSIPDMLDISEFKFENDEHGKQKISD